MNNERTAITTASDINNINILHTTGRNSRIGF